MDGLDNPVAVFYGSLPGHGSGSNAFTTFNMKMQIEGETLRISGLKELGAGNSTDFRDQARAALTPEQRHIEIDLSQTLFLDSHGLSSLISLHKTTCSRNGTVRLVNPTPGVQQLLELTRMHRLFEIARQQ